MALTVTANLTTISSCDATTGWAATTSTPTLEPDLKKQGTNSLGFTLTTNGVNTAYYTGTIPNSGDLSGQHIRMWANTTLIGYMDSYANGGMQFYIQSSSGNRRTWTVGGNDTYTGGWMNIVVYADDTTYSTDTGSPNTSSITEIGFTINTTSKPRNVVSTWLDYLRFGDGLRAHGDIGGTTPFDLNDVYLVDVANGYGIVDKIENVFFLSGELLLGDNSGTSLTDFEETSSLIVFTDKNVNTGLYKIQGVGNSTGATDIVMTGCVVKSAGAQRFNFDMDDANVDSLSVSGSTFDRFNNIYLQSGQSVTTTVFNDGNTIYPSTATFTSNTISNSNITQALKVVSGHNISDCSFLDNVHATWYDTAGSYDDDGNYYSGNLYDVENSSTGAVAISALNGSNVSTYTNTGGGSTTISNAVTLTVRGVKTGSEPTNYVRVRIETTGGTEILSASASTTDELNSGYYKATTSYNYSTDTAVIIKARYKGYLPFTTSGTITTNGLDVTAVWQVDPNFTP